MNIIRVCGAKIKEDVFLYAMSQKKGEVSDGEPLKKDTILIRVMGGDKIWFDGEEYVEAKKWFEEL